MHKISLGNVLSQIILHSRINPQFLPINPKIELRGNHYILEKCLMTLRHKDYSFKGVYLNFRWLFHLLFFRHTIKDLIRFAGD